MTKQYPFVITVPDKPYMLGLFVIFILYCLYGVDYSTQIHNNETAVGFIGSLLFGGAFALSPKLIQLQKIEKEFEEFIGIAAQTTEQVSTAVQQVQTSLQQGDIDGAVNTVSNTVPVVQGQVAQAVQIATQTQAEVKEVIQEQV